MGKSQPTRKRERGQEGRGREEIGQEDYLGPGGVEKKLGGSGRAIFDHLDPINNYYTRITMSLW